MAKTLITWPHGSIDGEREAKALQALYPDVSHWVDGAALGNINGTDYRMLIVVGHREEIEAQPVLQALITCIKTLGAEQVILANCNSGLTKTGGTLSDFNELWSPAQRVANETGAAVAATTRVLLFTEVGKGTAFGGGTHGITAINPEGETLWKEFRKQDPVDEITEGVSHL